MTAKTTTGIPAARRVPTAAFRHLLHAEWIKFRSVRGWMIGMIVAAVLAVLVGVFAAGNASIGCGDGPGSPQLTGKACLPYVPLGPGGEAVTDSFYFVRQPLTGNGSITVRVTSLTGAYSDGNSAVRVVPGQSPQQNLTTGLVPWAKAGIIIKATARQGAAYAAMVVTGGYGVRMQYDFTHDTAGLPGAVSAASPRWLRLTRSGDIITGYDSTDGNHWDLVGTAKLAGLARNSAGGPDRHLAAVHQADPVPWRRHRPGRTEPGDRFIRPRAQDRHLAAPLDRAAVGGGVRGDTATLTGGYHQAAGVYSVSGSGDIAPAVPGPGSGFPSSTIEQSLAGLFAGLIAVLVVAVMFVTAEYRRGLIRVTFAASPRRGAVLAAKAVVAGAVAFVIGLAAAVASVLLGVPRQRAEGLYILPASGLTEVRVLVGSAAMVAVAAVFAVGLGAVFRRSATAVTAAIVAIVLPFLLSVTVLPTSAADWLLRVTPAAGFAIEQSIPRYSQVTIVSAPAAAPTR